MSALLRILCLFLLLGVCKGNIILQALNPNKSVCAGEPVSFEVEITGNGDENDFILQWWDPNDELLYGSDHYSLNRTVLTIYNALPTDAGIYKVQIRDVTDDSYVRYSSFHLEVQGI
ncbi:hypothetical protein ACROYT_G006506 [Oculina patagonica]